MRSILCRFPDELVDAIDAARPATVSRNAWMRRAVETALSGERAPTDMGPARSGPKPAASPQPPAFRRGPKREAKPIPKAGKEKR